MNEKLLPCPFCGASEGAVHCNAIGTYSIMCFPEPGGPGCGAESGGARTKEGAIEEWNTRAQTHENAALKYTITPKVDYEKGTISLDTQLATEGFSEQISRQIIQTKDGMTRKGLISLGWTPPQADEKPASSESALKASKEELENAKARFESQLAAMDHALKVDCHKALETLAGAYYPTPVEGYGRNSSWAISDLCRCIHSIQQRLQEVKECGQRVDDKLAALEAQSNGGWISVTERLPGRTENVLLFCTNVDPPVLFEAYCFDKKWETALLGQILTDEIEVTHWMELPEGPQTSSSSTTGGVPTQALEAPSPNKTGGGVSLEEAMAQVHRTHIEPERAKFKAIEESGGLRRSKSTDTALSQGSSAKTHAIEGLGPTEEAK